MFIERATLRRAAEIEALRRRFSSSSAGQRAASISMSNSLNESTTRMRLSRRSCSKAVIASFWRGGSVEIAAAALTLPPRQKDAMTRSEEHTSELQSRQYLVCRLLLEKKKKIYITVAEFIVEHPHVLEKDAFLVEILYRLADRQENRRERLQCVLRPIVDDRGTSDTLQ